MNKYRQNYTKVAAAESILYTAQQLNTSDSHVKASEHIRQARQLLQEFLNQDNMIEDDEIAGGWIKSNDTFDDEQLDFIRDIFAERLQLRKSCHYDFIQQEMLDIINVCQRNLGCDEYKNVTEFYNDDSGVWTERKK